MHSPRRFSPGPSRSAGRVARCVGPSSDALGSGPPAPASGPARAARHWRSDPPTPGHRATRRAGAAGREIAAAARACGARAHGLMPYAGQSSDALALAGSRHAPCCISPAPVVLARAAAAQPAAVPARRDVRGQVARRIMSRPQRSGLAIHLAPRHSPRVARSSLRRGSGRSIRHSRRGRSDALARRRIMPDAAAP